jgi:Kip1 ubiquitination-promoting complex protein 1
VRQQGQSLDKVHRAMILAPLVGIVLNLRSSMSVPNHGMTYDLAHAIVSMDRSAAVISNFQYLTSYSWDVIFKGDPSVRRVEELKAFVSKLKAEWEEAKRQASEEELHELLTADLCSGA